MSKYIYSDKFTDFEKKQLEYINHNLNKSELFIASVVKVAKSGMSRTIKLAIVMDGVFMNVTYLMAKVLDKKLDKDGAFRVKGCGMDMIFAALSDIAARLCDNEHPYKWKAVQNYRYF